MKLKGTTDWIRSIIKKKREHITDNNRIVFILVCEEGTITKGERLNSIKIWGGAENNSRGDGIIFVRQLIAVIFLKIWFAAFQNLMTKKPERTLLAAILFI